MVPALQPGWDDGAGNPPNPNGLKTTTSGKQVLTRDGLTDIIENYAQIVETKDDKTGRRGGSRYGPATTSWTCARALG